MNQADDGNTQEPLPLPKTDDYWAFLSYRHADNTVQDRDWATWLQDQIEHYEVPADLVGTLNQWGEPIPERIYPIFRDEQSLAAKADLGAAIEDALKQSRYLVVLCSPRAVESAYVAQEIHHFKVSGKGERIIAAIVAGEPDDPEHECFPEPLRYPIVKGEIDTATREEPIAADFRLADGKEGFTSPEAYQLALIREGKLKRKAIKTRVDAYEQRLQLAKLKIIAGILGVTLEQLRDRDRLHQLELARKRARNLRRWLSTTVALLLLAIVGGLGAGYFFQQSEIRRQEAEAARKEAQLNEQRALAGEAEAEKQRTAAENNANRAVAGEAEAKIQGLAAESARQQAETEREQAEKILEFMTFQIRDKIGSYLPTNLKNEILETVDAYYEETGRNRTGAGKGRVVGHFNNLGNLALAEGDTEVALDYYEKSFVLSEELVAEEPDKPIWKVYLSAGHTKLGDVKLKLGRTDEALAHYEAALKVAEELVELDPGNAGYRRDLSISYNRLGDVKLQLGQTDG